MRYSSGSSMRHWLVFYYDITKIATLERSWPNDSLSYSLQYIQSCDICTLEWMQGDFFRCFFPTKQATEGKNVVPECGWTRATSGFFKIVNLLSSFNESVECVRPHFLVKKQWALRVHADERSRLFRTWIIGEASTGIASVSISTNRGFVSEDAIFFGLLSPQLWNCCVDLPSPRTHYPKVSGCACFPWILLFADFECKQFAEIVEAVELWILAFRSNCSSRKSVNYRSIDETGLCSLRTHHH